MDRIGIVGNGFVGNALHQGLKDYYTVLVYDAMDSRRLNTISEINELEIVFIAVPTPMNVDGSFDLNILKSAISMLSSNKIVIIKSTITPAAAEEVVELFPSQNFVFNPEFLTERTAVEDFKNPSRIVIGGNDQDSLKKVEEMYRVVFSNRSIKIIKTDVRTSCFIKYFSNCFFAAKVSLMNEFKQISDAAGVDWDIALDGLTTSGWVNPMHTLVPGPDGKCGFGGKCFPKDINAFMSYSRELGVDPKILQASWDKNLEVRKELDWLSIEGTVSKNT